MFSHGLIILPIKDLLIMLQIAYQKGVISIPGAVSIDACGGHSQRIFLTWRNDWHWMIYLRPWTTVICILKKKIKTHLLIWVWLYQAWAIYFCLPNLSIKFGNTHSLPLLYMGLIVLKCVLIHDTVHKK